jgi:pimeloyl-ACP methyl ester carboxylesterase
MKLHYRTIGEGKPLFILHGLFGSSDNWQTLGKKFAEDYQVFFVDQRNHGRSPHSEDFNYDLMVEDFAELVDDLGLEKINVVGHSMGGKTVIAFAAKYPDLIDKMVVADISHKAYEHHHDQIIKGLKAINLNELSSRGAADKVLAQYVQEIGVRQFLLKNLYWVEKGQLGWRINIPVLSRELDRIIEEIEFDTIQTETLFIRGELSNYILESDYDEIGEKFPNSSIETLVGSGHWVHAESPREFYSLVRNFIG